MVLLVLSAWAVRSEAKVSEAVVKAAYEQVLCTKCGMNHYLDEDKCTMVPEKRTLVRARLEEGHSIAEVVWNFNGDNISFMFALPQEVIRTMRCPCACGETVEVCIGELRGAKAKAPTLPGCPVIDEIMEDIRELDRQGGSPEEILSALQGDPYMTQYSTTIETRIRTLKATSEYYLALLPASLLPQVILDEAECSCTCTEKLRTCLLEMPWCSRLQEMIYQAIAYLDMGLIPEEAAASFQAPCGKTCGKEVTGVYLGINCAVCGRPVRDKAWKRIVNGEEKIFCCESCDVMSQDLPDEILDNVPCLVCDLDMTLRDENCTGVYIQRSLIKTWLLSGKTPEQIIARLTRDQEMPR